MNRVVPKFLTQFGIAADLNLRKKWMEDNLPDDSGGDGGMPFRTGHMSFAGSGKNSRTTEVFIVMPGTSHSQLDYFGINQWETPFGYVDPKDVTNVVQEWYSYGDMPPWGKGPDPPLMKAKDGYEYLKRDFPDLSYINKCEIISYPRGHPNNGQIEQEEQEEEEL